MRTFVFFFVQVISSNNASLIATLLQKTSNPSIVSSVPSGLFAAININTTMIPAANLPPAYVCYIFKKDSSIFYF